GRAYDNNTDATIHTGSASANFFASDSDGTTLNTSAAVGTFSDKHQGVNKTVTISGLTLNSNSCGDYQFPTPQPTTTATITALTLFVTGLSASNKTYDATINATLSGTAALLSNDAAGASTTDGHPYTGDTVSLTSTAASAFTGTFAS